MVSKPERLTGSSGLTQLQGQFRTWTEASAVPAPMHSPPADSRTWSALGQGSCGEAGDRGQSAGTEMYLTFCFSI